MQTDYPTLRQAIRKAASSFNTQPNKRFVREFYEHLFTIAGVEEIIGDYMGPRDEKFELLILSAPIASRDTLDRINNYISTIQNLLNRRTNILTANRWLYSHKFMLAFLAYLDAILLNNDVYDAGVAHPVEFADAQIVNGFDGENSETLPRATGVRSASSYATRIGGRRRLRRTTGRRHTNRRRRRTARRGRNRGH
jgi:hypothetical protein